MATGMFPVSDNRSWLIYSHDTVPGFGAEGQVESLSYPGEVCDRLKVILRDSNSLYPVARRTMGVFEVGFLERV
jgi:hypothetical protein